MSHQPATFKITRPESDDDLFFDILDIIWDNADFYSDEATFLHSIKPATKGQLGIYAATWYMYEVNNGGHYQFFSNSTGMVWQHAIEGFNQIGASKLKAILHQAISLFPDSKPSKDKQHRNEQLELIDTNTLDLIDDLFYDLPEEFDDFVVSYVNRHPADFFTNL